MVSKEDLNIMIAGYVAEALTEKEKLANVEDGLEEEIGLKKGAIITEAILKKKKDELQEAAKGDKKLSKDDLKTLRKITIALAIRKSCDNKGNGAKKKDGTGPGPKDGKGKTK